MNVWGKSRALGSFNVKGVSDTDTGGKKSKVCLSPVIS